MRIKDKISEKLVKFPKNLNNNLEKHKMVFKSEITNKEYSIEDLTDEGNLSDYYVFTLDLSQFDDGEYKYKIDEDACGLIILGELNPNNIEYKDNNNKYVVYEG